MYFIFVTDRRCALVVVGRYDRLVRPVEAPDYQPASRPAGKSAGPTTGRKLAGRNPIYPVEISVSGNTTTAACSMSTDRHIHGIMERTHGVRRGETLVISVVHVTDRFRYYSHRR